MEQSYKKNFLKIYFWQIFGFITNLLSLYIVTPTLSKSPVTFGIYSICASLTMYLYYADFGFLQAGYKYASEMVSRKDRKGEIQTIGFVIFIILIVYLFFSGVFLVFSYNPEFIIKNIDNEEELITASKLLMIMSVFTPALALRQFFYLVFSTRLESYFLQIVTTISNLVKILSIFYFFQNETYNITQYFLFFQLVSVISLLTLFPIVRNRYTYDFRELMNSIRFSREVYNKIKHLAYPTFFVTIAFFLYSEVDLFLIGRFIGAREAAVYSIGFSLMVFFRTINGIIFEPFSARFNHFVGNNEIINLRNTFYTIVVLLAPVYVFTVGSAAILMEPFILSWVGSGYSGSIPSARFLILLFIFHFIAQPSSLLVVAQEKVKTMYNVNIAMLIIYVAGVAATIHSLNILSFALFKFIIFAVSAICYFKIAVDFLELNFYEFSKKIILPLAISMSVLISILLPIINFLPSEKGKVNVIIVLFAGGAASIIALFVYSIFSQYFRSYIYSLIKELLIKTKR